MHLLSLLKLRCSAREVDIQISLPQDGELPLCVDLDGTLIATDTTWAAVRLWVGRRCGRALLALVWLCHGLAYFKQQLAARVSLDVSCLPYNQAVLQLITDYRERGGAVYLVTATDGSVATRVASHLGVFDGCYASDGVCNLRRKAKAARLCELFGPRRFIYVGNSRDDLAVWQQAHSAVIVSDNARLIAAAREISNVVAVLTGDVSVAQNS